MRMFGKLLLVTMVTAAFTSPASAEDRRCAGPPYGGSPDRYRAVLEAYGPKLGNLAAVLQRVCEVKFDKADRTPLYKLHFTDADIDSMDTDELTLAMFERLWANSNSK